MSLDLTQPRPASPASVVRWVGLGALLVAEVLALTLRFDTEALAGTQAWWADLLGHAHVLPRVAIAVAAATFLFGGARLRDELRQAGGAPRAVPAWPFLVGHLAALAGFVAVTAYVLEGDARHSPWAAGWAVAWAALGLLVLLLWAAALVPAARWLPLARRGLGPLLLGLGVGLAAWGAGQLTDSLWGPLSRWTFAVVRGLLTLLPVEVVCRPEESIIGTEQFGVQIAPECSGYEGIGLVWVFAGVYLWRCRHELRFPAALLLLPAATAAIWLFNALRIVALIAVGTWLSPEAARGGFHSQAGWLAFNGVALGMIVAARRVPWFRAAAAAPSARPDATVAYLAPLLVLVLTMMLTGAFVSGFDWAYPLRVVLTGAALWHFRRSYTDLRWRWSWAAAGFGAAVFVLWLALEPAPSAEATEGSAAALRGAPAGWAALWLVFRVLGSVVTVPLAEELAFRGYLTRQLIASDFETVPPGRFTWLSFVVSSVLFGLLHGRWLAGTLAGMAFALALYRRRQLADAVVAHAVANALLAAYVLAAGAWWLW